ncbi:hypothetical protein J2X90_000160 [Variovorax paradoxus]|uniref:hypothetical protein n=1 Tax=Variovorax paradoxus TaxID=34073 RepID=UPI002786DD8D|nr:hypothetical protein [Variovorax paradoxus]MDP9932937.1 hypothetical protein [Variovorax paradoxus]MDQ0022382.1 hypothetical protein [Variovorax paradoxus]
MRLSSLPVRLVPALVLASALSACGGGDGGGGFSGFLPGVATPTPTVPAAPPPETSVKPEMRCAP